VPATIADSGVVRDGGVGGEPEAYAGPCNIYASDYDQSCSVDSDCVGTLADLGGIPVESADYCSPGCLCGTGEAINKSAVAQFTAAVSNTPLLSDPSPGCFCSVRSTVGCCQNGRCSTLCYGIGIDGGVTPEAQDAEPAIDGG
jgi:hypothetical protein